MAASGVLLGQNDVIIAGKLGGATPNTSVASLASRAALPYDLRVRLPMITRISANGLRIAFTRNLGAFVGRSIPVVGAAILSIDAIMIVLHAVQTYNNLVKPEDRLT